LNTNRHIEHEQAYWTRTSILNTNKHIESESKHTFKLNEKKSSIFFIRFHTQWSPCSFWYWPI